MAIHRRHKEDIIVICTYLKSYLITERCTRHLVAFSAFCTGICSQFKKFFVSLW